MLTCRAIRSKLYLMEFHSFQNFPVRSATSLKDAAIYCCLQIPHLLVLGRNCARKHLTTLANHSVRPPFSERCCETTTNYVMSVPHLLLCAISYPSHPRPGNYFHISHIIYSYLKTYLTLKSFHLITEEQ